MWYYYYYYVNTNTDIYIHSIIITFSIKIQQSFVLDKTTVGFFLCLCVSSHSFLFQSFIVKEMYGILDLGKFIFNLFSSHYLDSSILLCL